MSRGRIRRAGGDILRLRLVMAAAALAVAGGVAWGQVGAPVEIAGCVEAAGGKGVCPDKPLSRAQSERRETPEVGGTAPAAPVAPLPEAPVAALPEPMMLPLVLTRAEPLAPPAMEDAPVSGAVAETAVPPAGTETRAAPVTEEGDRGADLAVLAAPEARVEPDAGAEPAVEASGGRAVAGPPASTLDVPATGPYYVQVGAFADPANAVRAAAALQAMGYAAGARNVVWEGDDLRAIAAGPFEALADAQAALSVLRAAGYAEAYLTN